MNRLITLLVALIALAANGYAKSPEKLIIEAIEKSDWLALDSLYKAAPEGSLSDFVDVYSRCLIGNRLNRPELSIPAFEQLFGQHSEELSKIGTHALIFAMDLSRVGDNAKAAAMLSSVIDNPALHLDS
ncbi:MAG: hypothetical protein K2H15_01225, partial [Muribaculaceae bacterium]|nr:hypothetical protein [Muribaculaceae bacterium]